MKTSHNVLGSFLMLVLFFTFFLVRSYGQIRNSQLQKDKIVATSDTVEVEALVNIAKKYGYDPELTWTTPPNARSATKPKKVCINMSLVQYEEFIKKLAFQNNKAKIMSQYQKDFENVKSPQESLDLRRSYLKMYPVYLQDLTYFQEETIKKQEKNVANLRIFNKNFDDSGNPIK